MEEVLMQKLRPEAVLPRRATPGSAGYDLCAALTEPLTLAPGEILPVPTGLALALPDATTVALVFARSGLSTRHGIALANGVGVIDSDYRGELLVSLKNESAVPYTVNPGDRIAQLLFMPVALPVLTETPDLPKTDRATGGFGSTGR